MTPNKRDRILWLDMAKGIGILLIMIGHLGIGNVPGWHPIYVWLYSFHVPLFFFLSGYLFSPGNHFKEFAVKKLRTILLPYFTLGTVIFVYNVYNRIRNNSYSTDWLRETLRRFLIQDRFWTIWFLACILVMNVMMYIMVRLCKKTWVLAVIAVVLAAIGMLYYHFGGDKLPWNVDVAFCAMPFFCGGYLIHRHSEKLGQLIRGRLRTVILFFVCLGCSILFCSLNYRLTHQVTDMFSMRYGIAPLMYLSAFGGIASTVIFSRWTVWRPICFIGENSLVYFALHQEVAKPIAKNILSNVHFVSTRGDPAWRTLLYIGVVLLLMLVILTAIVKLVNNTSLRKLIGKK